MAPPLPQIPGVEHVFLELETGVRVHVALAGPPDAPPVLALHGWPQHWWCWRRVIEHLDGAVRIACADLRGLGWSGWPADGDFAKDRLAGDALATLDALGWDRALLVGHDWGGVAAYLAGLSAPERLTGVLALGAPHPWQPPGRIVRNAWRFAYQLPLATPWLGSRLTHDGRFAAWIFKAAAGDPSALSEKDIEQYLAVLREDQAARATEALYRAFLLHDAPSMARRPRDERLYVPTRLLFGGREPLGTALAQGLEDHADDAQVELLDGCGHWVPEERPQVVAERIRAMAA